MKPKEWDNDVEEGLEMAKIMDEEVERRQRMIRHRTIAEIMNEEVERRRNMEDSK